MRRYGYAERVEPRRCVCEPGPDAHEQHCKPHRHAAHHGPDCPHSDLWRTAVQLAKRRQRRVPRVLLHLIA